LAGFVELSGGLGGDRAILQRRRLSTNLDAMNPGGGNTDEDQYGRRRSARASKRWLDARRPRGRCR